MDFTVAGQTHLGGQLDPSIDRGTVESFFEVNLGTSDIIRSDLVLIEDVEFELVLATTFGQVESEGLVPDGVIGVINDGSTLLVVIINP